MAAHDDKAPKDVAPKDAAPFANVIGLAIAQQLNEFYGELVREQLPDDLSALAQRLAAAMTQERKNQDA